MIIHSLIWQLAKDNKFASWQYIFSCFIDPVMPWTTHSAKNGCSGRGAIEKPEVACGPLSYTSLLGGI